MPSFDAGEYGFYIWTAYGLSAVVIGWLVADSLMRARRWRRAAEARKGADKP
jgi:heme exporter protein D